jgi:hypothetical protein
MEPNLSAIIDFIAEKRDQVCTPLEDIPEAFLIGGFTASSHREALLHFFHKKNTPPPSVFLVGAQQTFEDVQGAPRAIFPQIICRLRVQQLFFSSTLACERKIFMFIF